MKQNCPVFTPAERRINDMLDHAQQTMLGTVRKAIEVATGTAAEQMKAVGSQDMPPTYEYYAAVVHQNMFCQLCGADPDTFEGGNPEIAGRILDNGRKIAARYWTPHRADDVFVE